CCGEGETTIVPFFSSLLRGAPDTTVDGLVYRENGAVKTNPRPALLKDLDSLPAVDYSFLHHLETPESAKKAKFPIDVGRGCPFGCTYCSTNAFWGRKFRLKSPERIVEEIKQLHKQFGVTSFSLSHDMFTLNRESVIKTCRLLQGLDFPITWSCSARLDCIDPELIDIMTASGMEGIYIGIETGSKRMQKLINKNLDLSNALPLISYLTQKGCKIIASFIFGFPEETEEDLCQTMRLIADLLKMRKVAIQTHLCTFLAGTELSRRHLSEMTKAEQYSDITGDSFLPECSDLIDAHPELFPHLLEYKTPLRTKLRFFPIFFQTWAYLQPVYQYLSEKYPEDRLIDMYYDFVAANEAVLDDIQALPYDQRPIRMAQVDLFPKKFQGDACYDIIRDFCRYRIAETNAKTGDGAETCEVYCFSPKDIRDKASLQEYTRCIAVVRRKDGKTTISVSR
ncbi:MAG: B12-binding domain-containing radical SAM protein, partial [Oscillospiraceae bacterium]|nr:B12-binding domain-containing radical SAM protein [Oscillospiraceae bacterium]